MRRGICIKCGGNELYSLEPSNAGYQDLRLGGSTVFSEPSSYFVICAACGYAERYMHPSMVDKLRRKGNRLSG